MFPFRLYVGFIWITFMMGLHDEGIERFLGFNPWY
jgi:hypothetical protein